MTAQYTVPGLDPGDAELVVTTLQRRLVALIDLQLTLKHIHWNVVGPNFIGVHEMLDDQAKGVRKMSDEVAERIATLGHAPTGTPRFVADNRAWDDYRIGRATAMQHLAALDVAYRGLIADHRAAIVEFEKLDLITQDLLIGQSGTLERYQWFVRAHLEDPSGKLAHSGASGEQEAAESIAPLT
ncbi:MAG: Dps family protein [Egibacteraceae bacterium]